MADKDVGSYQILELMREAQQLRKAKNGREAVALGRHGGRLFPCQEFLHGKNSARWTSAGMRMSTRARDRRGAEQTRRGAAGPEAKPEPRIARSPPDRRVGGDAPKKL
jgi:hypothetical protein